MFLDLDEQSVLKVAPDVIATECIVILGMRGSGKSNSVARVLEQAMAFGVTASIIDPHNEYAGLRDRFPVYVAGRDAEIPIQPQNGALLARWVYDNAASVILAIKDFSTDERQRFLLSYVQTLKRLHMANRRAHMLVVEEAHNFIPQVGNNPLKQELGIVAVEGRKFGLGMLISDQRSANVDKTVLTQAGIILLHRATGVTDLNTYQDIADLPNTKQIARKLRIGEAVAILHYDVSFEPQIAQIKRRETTHGGDTPALENVPTAISQDAIASLATLLSKQGQDEESEQAKLIRNLKQQVAGLEVKLAEKDNQITRLTERAEFLSMLTVKMEGGNGAPSVMDVERIHAGQIVTQGNAPVNLTPSPPLQPSERGADLHKSIQNNAARLNDHAQKLQRRSFEQLLSAVKSAERMQVYIMKALISASGRCLTYQQLQALTGYKFSTITSSGMGKLSSLGLIESVRGRGYRSKAREKLAADFPALDTDSLIHELLEIIR